MEKSRQSGLTLEPFKSQTDLSTFNDSYSHRQPFKRFARCGSSSRSRSKEDPKEKLSNHFFVKNICQSLVNSKVADCKSTCLSPRIGHGNMKNSPRQVNVLKNRADKVASAKPKASEEMSICKQLQYLNMERKYFDNQVLRSELVAVNRELQSKIALLESKFQEYSKESCFLLEKIHYYEQRENARLGIKSPRKDVQRLKRQIITEHKHIDAAVQLEALRTEMQGLRTQNSQLKDALQESERKIGELQKITKTMVNQQQNFLNELATRLKGELSCKEELIRRMQIQLNVFQAKECRRSERSQAIRIEQLAHLKKKYMHVLVKYHQMGQELAVLRRREQSPNLCQGQNTPASASSSLSLSP